MLSAISSHRPLEAGRADRTQEFAAALDAACRGIRDPVVKLRYIRGSLARYQLVLRWVDRLPCPPLRRAIYRWLSLEGMQHLVLSHPLGPAVTSARKIRRSLRLSRLAAALAFVSTLAIMGGIVIAVFESRPVSSALPSPQVARPPVQPPASPPPQLPVVAESLDTAAIGVTPQAIWLVEKDRQWEQYSNGLRVDTTHTAAGDAPRRYRVFSAQGFAPEVLSQPVGILFHTSESDVWPLEAAFNENLRDSSSRLLRYIRRLKLYNYVIDRFGRVYRVVVESDKANHAGNSVWSQGSTIYLNLNNAFLGICFETRWEGGTALPITQAQLAAGRVLTEYLRHRYQIAAELCTGHGLTSVNPRKHLIGHHLDWARGFPFQAFGLPDQYQRSLPAVELFAFGYDENFLKVLGQPWPGVRKAESLLNAEAAERRIGIEDLRREKRETYDRWLEEQTGDEKLHAAGRSAERSRAPSSEAAGAGSTPSAGGAAATRNETTHPTVRLGSDPATGATTSKGAM